MHLTFDFFRTPSHSFNLTIKPLRLTILDSNIAGFHRPLSQFSHLHLKHKQSFPIMSSVILLDDPNKEIYFSGDIVRGRVVFIIAKQMAVGQVGLTFSGLARATHTRHYQTSATTSHTITYYGRVTLFWYEKVIYQGHGQLRAGTYEWPFDFVFPTKSDTSPTLGDSTFVQSLPFLATGDPHLLPPTFSYYSGSSSGRIEYTPAASWTRKQHSGFWQSVFGKNATLSLAYAPRRNIEKPDLGIQVWLEPRIAKTLRLLPEI